jgi:NitT/TauT family transport system substrate-binding protein
MTRRLLRTRRPLWAAVATLAMASLLALTGCSSGSDSAGDPTADSTSPAAAEVTTLRLGFFPNLTHAPAFVGLQEGFYKDALGEVGVKVAPQLFNAGPDAVNALFSDSIDIAFVGPNPTVSGWTQSKGEAIKVISGAASGGASLVVKPDITSPADLAGKTIATPQLGNTQDVALRYWLKQQGYETTPEGGGDVQIQNISNSDTVTAFQAGEIDGAWVPEPFATQLVADGGTELVNEKSLWPGGKFVTTDIVVRQQFLAEHPDIVKAFLTGNVQAIDFINASPEKAQADFNAGLQALTGSGYDTPILKDAWKQVTFTNDPLKKTLVQSAAHAVDVGLLEQSEIDAAGGFDPLYDLTLLNEVLAKDGQPEVKL